MNKKPLLSLDDRVSLEKIAADGGQKYGIENLKKIQIWKAEVIKEVYGLMKKRKSGKRVTGWAALLFFDDSIRLGKILKNYKEIEKEFNDLNAAEIAELDSTFNQALSDIPENHKYLIAKINTLLILMADGILDIYEAI